MKVLVLPHERRRYAFLRRHMAAFRHDPRHPLPCRDADGPDPAQFSCRYPGDSGYIPHYLLLLTESRVPDPTAPPRLLLELVTTDAEAERLWQGFFDGSAV